MINLVSPENKNKSNISQSSKRQNGKSSRSIHSLSSGPIPKKLLGTYFKAMLIAWWWDIS